MGALLAAADCGLGAAAGRMGRVEKVAKGITCLCGDAAAYLAGQSLSIHGRPA